MILLTSKSVSSLSATFLFQYISDLYHVELIPSNLAAVGALGLPLSPRNLGYSAGS